MDTTITANTKILHRPPLTLPIPIPIPIPVPVSSPAPAPTQPVDVTNLPGSFGPTFGLAYRAAMEEVGAFEEGEAARAKL